MRMITQSATATTNILKYFWLLNTKYWYKILIQDILQDIYGLQTHTWFPDYITLHFVNIFVYLYIYQTRLSLAFVIVPWSAWWCWLIISFASLYFAIAIDWEGEDSDWLILIFIVDSVFVMEIHWFNVYTASPSCFFMNTPCSDQFPNSNTF
mgnify:CR=1 FL=1